MHESHVITGILNLRLPRARVQSVRCGLLRMSKTPATQPGLEWIGYTRSEETAAEQALADAGTAKAGIGNSLSTLAFARPSHLSSCCPGRLFSTVTQLWEMMVSHATAGSNCGVGRPSEGSMKYREKSQVPALFGTPLFPFAVDRLTTMLAWSLQQSYLRSCSGLGSRRSLSPSVGLLSQMTCSTFHHETGSEGEWHL